MIKNKFNINDKVYRVNNFVKIYVEEYTIHQILFNKKTVFKEKDYISYRGTLKGMSNEITLYEYDIFSTPVEAIENFKNKLTKKYEEEMDELNKTEEKYKEKENNGNGKVN